ncbi:MAG: 5'/3'-nucleotidase SurE [Planctomycetota bacterium]
MRKILLTNDDGWGYDGIRALENVASEFGEVWTMAPMSPMSGISHQITFEQPMRLEQKGPRSFSLQGTPADCVRVALTQLDVEFDWVLSGVNRGGNLGSDVNFSGTVAAAREASLFQVNSIAISQLLKQFRQPFAWQTSEYQTRRVLESLFSRSMSNRTWFNVNLPHVELQGLNQVQLRDVELDPNPLPAEYRRTKDDRLLYCGVYRDRPKRKGCDVEVCFAGDISITTFNP